MPSDADLPPCAEPVQIFGDVEAIACGLAYGAMVFDVKPGCSIAPHSHASEEIWWVREGAGRATVGGQEFDVAAGTRLTVPPDTPHLVVNTSEHNLRVMAFWWREARHDE